MMASKKKRPKPKPKPKYRQGKSESGAAMRVSVDAIAAYISANPEVAGLAEVELAEFDPADPEAVVLVGWRLSREGYDVARYKVYSFEAQDEDQGWAMLEHAFRVHEEDRRDE